jgi:squalene-associated FAD-dependent desaturase
MKKHRTSVAIIGGGIAGMAAAFALTEQDHHLDVTLFESKRFAGGRAGSFVDSQTGQNVDYCQHVAMGCCTNLLSMMDQAGIDDPFIRYRELTFHHPKHPPSRFAKSRFLPAPFHLVPSLCRLRYLTWFQRYQIARATFALMRSTKEKVSGLTALQWLTQNRQSPSTIRDYWDVVIASALGESCERVSMAAARKVFMEGFLVCPEASDVLVPKLPLGSLFGHAIPAALASRGVTVRTGTKVRSLRHDAAGKITLEFEDRSSGFDHVILAVPFFSLSRILSASTASAAGLATDRYARIPCSPISGIHLWFDRPVMTQPHAVLVGTLAQWVFRREDQSDPAVGGYVQVVVSASHDLRQLDSGEVISRVVAEIQHAFPESRHATLIRGRVVTDPQSVYSVSPEVDSIRPNAATALPCLHLAGDFVQTGWPATMEGAVISGRLAASSVLQRLGFSSGSMIHPGLPRPWLSRCLIRP